MLENLAYCLNATAPIFLLMLLGLVFRRLGFFSQAFADKLNDFVFKVGLPVMLFKDLVESDFFTVWDGPFVLFCFLATLGSILLTAALSLFCRERPAGGIHPGGLPQQHRSAWGRLSGESLRHRWGGQPGDHRRGPPLQRGGGDGALPHQSPAERPQPGRVKESPQGYCHEPHHPGYRRRSGVDAAGHPPASDSAKTVSSLSATATPLGLMALGASFDLKKALGRWKPAFAATAVKLVLLAALFLPIAVAMGVRDDKLVAALAMLASPTTVSSFVMARSMGHEGTLTASTVMLTTFFSILTLTLWLYLLRTLGLI